MLMINITSGLKVKKWLRYLAITIQDRHMQLPDM